MPCSLFSSLLSRKTRFLYPSETVSSLLFSTFTRSIFQVIIVQGLALLVFFTTFAKKKQIYTNLDRLRRRAPLPDEESGKGRACP